MSDHGFKQFRRGVNLNSWFYRNGYLSLKDGKTKSGELVYLHAEKDQANVVENDETIAVGNDRAESIGRDRSLEVGHR